jgi:hypothetical protein
MRCLLPDGAQRLAVNKIDVGREGGKRRGDRGTERSKIR